MNPQKKDLTTSVAPGGRNLHLDGIRGIAALSVALFHFFRSFDNQFISYEKPINHSLLSSMWNGHFAVALFFVLSGYIFFKKFYLSSFKKGLNASVKRFLRLSIPIMCVCFFAYLIHRFGLFYNAEASVATQSDWLARWYKFQPDLKLAIIESIWTDFVSFDPTLTYNSNLWTISYELFAVIIVIAFAIGCKFINFYAQVFFLAVLLFFSYNTHYFEFMLGAALGLLTSKHRSLPLLVSIAFLILALSMAALALPPTLMPFSINATYPIAAFLLLASVSMNNFIAKIFSNPVFIKLGDISFGLYLIHFLTINSIASFIFLKTGSLSITFFLYISSTLILSYLFASFVDHPWTHLLDRLFRKQSSNFSMSNVS